MCYVITLHPLCYVITLHWEGEVEVGVVCFYVGSLFIGTEPLDGIVVYWGWAAGRRGGGGEGRV